MDLPEEALQASESARARAFADLLAARYQTAGEISPDSLSKNIFSYSSAPPLSLQEIKEIVATQKGIVLEYFLLPGHSSLVEECQEKDSLIIWIILPKQNTSEISIKMIQVLVDIEQLNADINQLVKLMTEGLGGDEAKRSEVSELLRRLNRKLIEPLEKNKLLPIDLEARTVITIIPHGHLFSVPFAALLDGKDKYLVEKYPLNYAISLSLLKYLQANKTNVGTTKQRRLLALVNPNPLPQSEEGYDSKLLPQLLKTAEYFPNIASFYTPPNAREIFTGIEATNVALREHAASADVLYFATHAEVNVDDPLNSFIALAKTNQHDGYFRVLEASELHLQAELVILAACETGRGKLSSDGINGLSRAFTQAGALALLMSLWKVPEERTTILMVGFHDYWLRKDHKKAVSLQSAQKELLKSEVYRTQPNLWAGFVLFGGSN
jgi:CHAT domain-containing protein